MLNFIYLAARILLLLLLVLVITSNAFNISIEIGDFLYTVSSVYLFIPILIFLSFLFVLQSFYFKTQFQLYKFKFNKKIQNKQKGYQLFMSGMIALANKNYKKATSESRNISKFLTDEPSLNLLLKSEIFKIENKFDALNNVYEEMTKNDDTKNLGYRGLMEQYLRSQDYHHAFIYAEKLFNNNPYIEKIYETLVNIMGKTNNWQQLLYITKKAYSKRIINESLYKQNLSIAFFEIAKIKRFSDIKESINCIKKALNFRKNFVPYLKLYIDLLIQNKNYRLARTFTKKAWNQNSHLELNTSIIKLAESQGVEVVELAKYVIGSRNDNYASKILMIEAYILNKRWNEARNQIKSLIDAQPNKQICLLMAKIEEGDTGDIQKVNSWTLRSRNGAENNIWVCMLSKSSQNEWSSVSNSGHFNSLEWRQPFMLNKQSEHKDSVINEY